MHFVDWLLVLLPVLLMIGVAAWTQRYMKSVADFMAASRCAGRYLICNARGEAGFGAVSGVAIFEYYYQSGLTMTWWNMLTIPVGLIVCLTGFVIYRYRQTRVMTLAQFFEVRYNKSTRVLAGFLAFLSGLVNYGIFPAVSARFFVYFCGFPQTLHFGALTIPTFLVIMLVCLSISTTIVLVGGQLTVMVADCMVGLISMLFYTIVAFTLVCLFRWSQIAEALGHQPPGKSLINPFDAMGLQDFNVWYVLIGIFGSIYGTMCWQGGYAFNSSAANPHEAKMGNILGVWRGSSLGVMLMLLGVCAYTFMHHPHFSTQAAMVNHALEAIKSPQIREQMTVPMTLGYMLPVGIKGMLCAIMLLAWLSCDGSYQHSWGSIFIQDNILPFRKKPFTPKQHILLLRLAIIGVSLFGFLFSWLFPQQDYVLMFFALTGTIFLGGAGSLVIGGLYWKKGTTAGAWTAMLIGSGWAVLGFMLQQVWKPMVPTLMAWFPGWSDYLSHHADKFPINGQWMYFIAMCSAMASYVGVSLLTCKEDFNLDRMLHRGKYAIEEKRVVGEKAKSIWQKIIGFSEEFTRGDKILSISVFTWSMFWFAIFVVISLWNMVQRWPLSWWSHYWQIYQEVIPLLVGTVTTVWFIGGGIRDLGRMFKSLETVKRSDLDNGMVVGHHNLDETNLPEDPPNGQNKIQAEEASNLAEPEPTPFDDRRSTP